MGDTPPESVGLAVLASRVDDLRDDIRLLREDLATSRTTHVTRGEWEQRNHYSDSKFGALGRELGDLRTEVQSRRAPWWNVVTSIAAIVAILLSVLP